MLSSRLLALKSWGRKVVASPLFAHVVLPFLMQRTVLVCAAVFMSQFLDQRSGFRTGLPRLIDMWARWDSVYYLAIAAEGYGGWADAFFPLYPLLTAALGLLMPLAAAGWVAANLAAVTTLGLLYLLVRDMEGVETAKRTVVVALLFPTSFFLSAVYAESTYLACCIGTFYALHRQRRLLAAALVFAACLARPQGFLCLTFPFAVGWLWHSRRWRQFPWFTVAALFAAAALLLIHYLYTGDPLGFVHADSVQHLRVFWGRSQPSPEWWAVLLDEGMSSNLMRRLLNWSALMLTAIGSIHLFRQGRIEYALLCLATLALPLYFHASIFDAASMARYALLCFPLMIVLARWTREGRCAVVMDWGFAMLQLVLFSLFTSSYWAE